MCVHHKADTGCYRAKDKLNNSSLTTSFAPRLMYDEIARKGTPKYPSTDNDPLFLYHRLLATLSILEVDEIKTVPYVPLSHPFIQRLILSVRKELLV
jgi:hypothetical protein